MANFQISKTDTPSNKRKMAKQVAFCMTRNARMPLEEGAVSTLSLPAGMINVDAPEYEMN